MLAEDPLYLLDNAHFSGTELVEVLELSKGDDFLHYFFPLLFFIDKLDKAFLHSFSFREVAD
jgi:hypothetical protein